MNHISSVYVLVAQATTRTATNLSENGRQLKFNTQQAMKRPQEQEQPSGWTYFLLLFADKSKQTQKLCLSCEMFF